MRGRSIHHPPVSGGTSLFEECLEQQLALCQSLEALADALPSQVDARTAEALADRLRSTLRRCHRMEETLVFPILLATGPEISSTLDRLRREHVEDEDHACDVEETVRTFVLKPDRRVAEDLGYMLRCLFMPLRRHLAFDRDHILPIYRRNCES